MLCLPISASARASLPLSGAAAHNFSSKNLFSCANSIPGFGIEFEYRGITFESDIQTTTAEDFRNIKGALIILDDSEVRGDNWELTAEHQSDFSIGTLTPEWIIDGKTVALGSGKASEATSEIVRQMKAWKPSSQNGNPITIKGFDQYKWNIALPPSFNPTSVTLAPQVTAPLPLEAIHDLFLKARREMPNELIVTGKRDRISHMHVVQRSHLSQDGKFPARITPNDAPDDVLGFLSLLVSYAKYADRIQPKESPKFITPIMPRTDFLTMFNSIKHRLPAQGYGQLFDLVKDLAVFKGDGTDDVDPDFSVDGKRVPSEKIDTLKFHFADSLATPDQDSTLLVSHWINGLQENRDMLAVMDNINDGQIGGLGSRMENVLGTSRLVPIFEFRDLTALTLEEAPEKVSLFEQIVIEYHRRMKKAPKVTRRNADGTQNGLPSWLKCIFACPGSTSASPRYD